MFRFRKFVVSENYRSPYGHILNNVHWRQPTLIYDPHKKWKLYQEASHEYSYNFPMVWYYSIFVLWWHPFWISDRHKKHIPKRTSHVFYLMSERFIFRDISPRVFWWNLLCDGWPTLIFNLHKYGSLQWLFMYSLRFLRKLYSFSHMVPC